MRITHQVRPEIFIIVLDEHEPIPPEWARHRGAEIWREVAIETPAGRNVLVKALGEV